MMLGINIPRVGFVMSVFFKKDYYLSFIKASKMSWTVLQATRATSSSAESVPVQVQ